MIKLFFYRIRGGIRMRWQQLSTVRGLVYAALILLFILFVWNSLSGSEFASSPVSPAIARGLMPAVLLFGCLLSALTTSGPALYFSETEHNLLFSAPIARFRLVLYKTGSYAASAVLSAALLSLFLPKILGSTILAFIATFITLVFIQLCSATINLGFGYAGKRLQTDIAFRPILIILLLLILVAVAYTLVKGPNNIASTLVELNNSTLMRIALLPFYLVSELHFAQSLQDFFLFCIAGILVISALILSIVYLDKYLIEESMFVSLAAQQNWKRILRSGVIWKSNARILKSAKVPPRAGGFAPIAWAQWHRAMRTSLKTIIVFALVAVFAGPALAWNAARMSDAHIAAGLFFSAVFFLPRFICFDFRTSLDSMQYLKTLPVAPVTICLAQIIVPILITSGIEIIGLICAIPFLNSGWVVLTIAIPLIVFFNMIVYLTENTIILLFPNRLVPVGRVDFDFLGRTLGEFLAKTVVLSIVFGSALYFATILMQDGTSKDASVFKFAPLLTLLLVFLFLLVYILTHAYKSFDVTHSLK